MVRKVCADAAAKAGLRDVEIVAPLPVWDGDGKSMGVQIKLPRLMGGKQACVSVGSFVLTPADLTSQAAIHRKAATISLAMALDLQISIKPLKAEKVA